MSVRHTVFIGHANGDVHSIQVLDSQQPGVIATKEAEEIGKLTNAGFRTVVASAWLRDETKTAGLLYAAAWNENEVEVLLRHGDRIASSHALYASCMTQGDERLTAAGLLRFCGNHKIG